MANILGKAWRSIAEAVRGAPFTSPLNMPPEFRFVEEAELRSRLRALEEAWGDEIDSRERLHDVPGFGNITPSFVFSEHDLRDIRFAARVICQADATACGILEKLTNYVIRTGFTYTAEAEKDVNAPSGLVEEIQKVIDECRDLNDFDNDLDREIFATAHQDGDEPIVLYCDSFGQTRIRTLDADQIQTPDTRPEVGRDWSYGVDSSARDVQSVYGYHVRWPSGWDYVPASRMEHIKLNVRRSVKRGLSDFYPVHGTLKDASKLLRNISRGAQIQAAIAFIREHAAGTGQAGIQSMVSGLAAQMQVANYPAGAKTEYRQVFNPGKILDVAGVKYHPGPMGQTNAPLYIEVLQALWRCAAQRWSMPEYMVSSDASNANFSSTLVAGDPFVIYCEQQQAYFGTRFLRIFWKALHNAYIAGRFYAYGVSWSDILKVIDVKAVPPDVANRDKDKETARRSTLYQQRVISLKQWRQEEGYDPDEMEAQVAEEPGPVVAGFGVGFDAGVGTTTADATLAPATDGSAPTNAVAADQKQEVQVNTDLVLNGAQIQAAVDIVTAVSAGKYPRDTGLGQLKVLFNLSDEQAAQIMGSAGTSLPTTPNPVPAAAQETSESYQEHFSQAVKKLFGEEGYP
jgi:hypothetical protein